MLDDMSDGVSVRRPHHEGAQNQHVQRALHHLSAVFALRGHHFPPLERLWKRAYTTRTSMGEIFFIFMIGTVGVSGGAISGWPQTLGAAYFAILELSISPADSPLSHGTLRSRQPARPGFPCIAGRNAADSWIRLFHLRLLFLDRSAAGDLAGVCAPAHGLQCGARSEEHTSELQSLR